MIHHRTTNIAERAWTIAEREANRLSREAVDAYFLTMRSFFDFDWFAAVGRIYDETLRELAGLVEQEGGE